MIAPRRKKMTACSVMALLTAVALSMPPARAASAPGLRMQRAASSDAYDDGLMFSNDGPMALLTNRSRRSDNSDLLRFEIDACGQLEWVEHRHSLIRQSALDDGMDLYDDVDDDPSDLGFELIEHWLAAHPEIAVIFDGVDKSCEGSWFDQDLPPELIAGWRIRPLRQGDARLLRSQRTVTADIA